MSAPPVAVAYVPVLHEGYRRFVEQHARGGRMFVVGADLHAEERALAKDIRALPAELVANAIAAWGIATEVSVLDGEGAETLAAQRPVLTLPADDVSYRLVERYFDRCEVRFDTVFLRWDKTRTAQLLIPTPQRTATSEELSAALSALVDAAQDEASHSIDWWRRVGAAIRLRDGEVISAHNEHNPHPLSAYAAGDPRSNFHKGLALELSTATHAEARLIAQAARDGRSTEGAVLYVTDFPCPPCAKLIAAAGIARVYYSNGYAVLDGQDVLECAGIEIVRVA